MGWRISSTVYALSAYSIDNGNVTELMTAPSYTKYEVNDLDSRTTRRRSSPSS